MNFKICKIHTHRWTVIQRETGVIILNTNYEHDALNCYYSDMNRVHSPIESYGAYWGEFQPCEYS
jgi:hypothetical protein